MATHSTLTDKNLHPAKGIESAAKDTIYTADGAGGGSWSAPSKNTVQTVPVSHGFAAQKDTDTVDSTVLTKISVYSVTVAESVKSLTSSGQYDLTNTYAPIYPGGAYYDTSPSICGEQVVSTFTTNVLVDTLYGGSSSITISYHTGGSYTTAKCSGSSILSNAASGKFFFLTKNAANSWVLPHTYDAVNWSDASGTYGFPCSLSSDFDCIVVPLDNGYVFVYSVPSGSNSCKIGLDDGTRFDITV